MKPLITICLVSYNSSDFVFNLLESLEKLTFNSFQVIIRDNNSKLSDFNKLKKGILKYQSPIQLYRVETNLKSSLAHGEALNDLINKIDTTYGLIVDADVCFLSKNWDQFLLEKINEQNPIYGAQADTLSQKPKDFPQVFISLFLTKIFKSLKIDLRPKDISNSQDTGWEMREKFLAQNLKSNLLYDFNTRYYRVGPLRRIVCSEYYLDSQARGHIFASHFGRGSAPKAKTLIRFRSRFLWINKTINLILRIPNLIKWSYDKSCWLYLCRAIINEQN